MIANAPLLVTRFIMPVISIATGVGMVTAGIALGVSVSKQSDFTNTKIVLQSPATVVLNRFIEPNELPYFYDVLETMDLVVANVKEVLNATFGEKFVTVELTNFSSTPTVTSSNKKSSTLIEKILQKIYMSDPPPAIKTSNISTTYSTTDYTPHITPFDNCTISVLTSTCNETYNQNNGSCVNETIEIPNCVNATINIVECVNASTPVYNCSDQINDTITCVNATIKIPQNCSNRSGAATTASISPIATTTDLISNNESQCEPPENATVQSSIIVSKMFIYFAVKTGESISVEDIISALKNLEPTIVLYNVCKDPSYNTSSFNSTLSMVEPPTQVDIDLGTLESQPSIPSSLQDSVDAAALEAARNAGLLDNSTSSVTPSTG